MEDLLEMKKLTPENTAFSETAGGFLRATADGKEYERVAIYRMFPNTEKEKFLSVREATEKAPEIGIIFDLEDFPEETRAMIRKQLLMRYFTPKIRKFLKIREEYGHVYFTAETDVGPVRFTIRAGGNSVAHIGGPFYRITDLDGNRYDVEDIYALSNKELRQFELYI